MKIKHQKLDFHGVFNKASLPDVQGNLILEAGDSSAPAGRSKLAGGVSHRNRPYPISRPGGSPEESPVLPGQTAIPHQN
jgi:hypothetical protein